MLHSVIKQHKIHDRVNLIVVFQGLCEQFV